MKKRRGKFTGWVSYAISRTEKLFDEINSKTWYPARQDRLHDLSVVGVYNISERLTISTAWVYYTGNAVTFPSGKYYIDDQVVFYYTERNSYRMPDYHRLDIGATLYNKKFKTVTDMEGNTTEIERKWSSSWNFSIYNAYGRENAYTITFSNDVNGNTVATRVALFKVIPSISYNFKF